MLRARKVTEQEFDEIVARDLNTRTNPFDPYPHGDFKPSNFGVLEKKKVKIDYGGTRPRHHKGCF
jgi:hypothetical protein